MTGNIWKLYMCTAVKKWDISDPRSYEHYWTSRLNETWKKFRPVKNFKTCKGLNFFQVSFTTISVVFIVARIAYILWVIFVKGDWGLHSLWELQYVNTKEKSWITGGKGKVFPSCNKWLIIYLVQVLLILQDSS